MSKRTIAVGAIVAWFCFAAVAGRAAAADDAFYSVQLKDLKLTEGQLPEWRDDEPQYQWRRTWRSHSSMRPYAVLDGSGEAYVRAESITPWVRSVDVFNAELVARAPRGKDVTGRLYFPKRDWSGQVVLRFKISPKQAKADYRNGFFAGRQAYYQDLLNRGLAGGAWFRHEVRHSQQALGGPVNQQAPLVQPPTQVNNLEDTYSLFSGGRAISENLQLDRVLLAPNSPDETVELSSLKGISIAEIKWDELIKDKHPQLDPLANRIPADQHAAFFPSFAALVRLIDQLNDESTVVLQFAEPQAQDAGTLGRYEKQLGVSLSAAARAIGPALVKTAAITGGDPYYRTGTDVAVLFETDQPKVLRELLWAQIKLAAGNGSAAKIGEGELAGAKFTSARSDDRKLCSYLAVMPGAVVLTNSQQQLERLLATAKGGADTLAKLPEYAFFRDRYKLGDTDETALVFLSDAAIRRWCSPRWRIAASRRTRDLAVLSELQATHFQRLARGQVQTGPLYTDLPMASAGEVTLTPAGVVSDATGTIAFQTPIGEMALDRVGRAEADAYNRWRDGYQQNWRWAFDPIALRLTVNDGQLAGDLSVMPLIGGTQYRELIGITRGAKLAPDAGDPHDALLHFVLAINRKSPTVQQYSNLAGMLSRDVRIDPLSWLGDSVAVYFDPDPFWADLAKHDPDKYGDFLAEQDYRLPLALRVEVSSGLKLAVFLAGVRAFIDQTGPGLTAWDSQTYRDQPYTRIRATERAHAPQGLDRLAIYYSVIGDGLVITPNESVLQRAIDRQLAKDADAKQPADEKPGNDAPQPKAWLGENVAVQANRGAVDALGLMSGAEYQTQMQVLAWSNIPILNEWRRLFPDQDPVALHEKFWHTRLVCPGGGKYTWNDEYQTMASTVYGHPGQPQTGPDRAPILKTVEGMQFGLSFEGEGLRARVEIERRKPE